MFPPPPTGVCPPSAISFPPPPRLHPRGAECGKNEFPPGLLATRRLGSLPDAACTPPAPPGAVPSRPRYRSRTGSEEARAAGAEPPRRSSQAAPGGALGRAPACSWGIRWRGESVPGNPALRTQAANKKLRSCSLPPRPPRPRRAPGESSAKMQQVAPGARGAPCAA